MNHPYVSQPLQSHKLITLLYMQQSTTAVTPGNHDNTHRFLEWHDYQLLTCENVHVESFLIMQYKISANLELLSD